MRLVFSAPAGENAKLYAATDHPLWGQLAKVLEAIEAGSARARQTPLRMAPGGTAWLVEVTVPGRDDTYQVIWAHLADQKDVVRIIDLGPRSR